MMASNSNGMRFSPFASGIQTPQQLPVMKVPPKPKQCVVNASSNNLSGSETDASSNENLSKEERYVIKHTARVEPQGQENLVLGKMLPLADSNQGRKLFYLTLIGNL